MRRLGSHERAALAAVLAAAVLGPVGAGCGPAKERVEVRLPADTAERAPDPDAYARPFGAALSTAPASEDTGYLARFVETFTSMTPENAMKWTVIEPRRGKYDFREADELVDAAEQSGKRVRGHPLVWDQQLPNWLTQKQWKPAELEEILREHVRRLVSRYRGRVAVWDVVNEPFEDDGTWSKTIWHETLGERFVEIAFRAARAADPDAQLYLNEIAAEFPGEKSDALFALARDLKERGVPIDGVGLQNHTTAARFPTRRLLERTMRRYGRAGLDVEITEMDVVLPEGATPDAALLARQAEAYAAAAQACAAAENCAGLTVWGITDRWSWLGADRHPLPFDAGGEPKPALRALRRALRAAG